MDYEKLVDGDDGGKNVVLSIEGTIFDCQNNLCAILRMKMLPMLNGYMMSVMYSSLPQWMLVRMVDYRCIELSCLSVEMIWEYQQLHHVEHFENHDCLRRVSDHPPACNRKEWMEIMIKYMDNSWEWEFFGLHEWESKEYRDSRVEHLLLFLLSINLDIYAQEFTMVLSKLKIDSFGFSRYYSWNLYLTEEFTQTHREDLLHRTRNTFQFNIVKNIENFFHYFSNAWRKAKVPRKLEA